MQVLTKEEQVGFYDFPKLLKAFFSGAIQEEHILGQRFKFSYRREFIFPSQKNHVPYFVTHLNMRLPILGARRGSEMVVNKNECEAQALTAYFSLINIILLLEKEGKVTYEKG